MGAAGVVGVVAVVHGSIAAIVLSGVSVSVALTLWVSVVELRRTPTPTRPCVDDEGDVPWLLATEHYPDARYGSRGGRGRVAT